MIQNSVVNMSHCKQNFTFIKMMPYNDNLRTLLNKGTIRFGWINNKSDTCLVVASPPRVSEFLMVFCPGASRYLTCFCLRPSSSQYSLGFYSWQSSANLRITRTWKERNTFRMCVFWSWIAVNSLASRMVIISTMLSRLYKHKKYLFTRISL